MKYKAIKGKFHVKGYSPDGDSIRFVADDKNLQKWFAWKEKENADKAAGNKEIRMQLRLEGVDALETHYNYKYHQPRAFAIAGMDTLLKLLGIEVAKYSIDYTKIVEADDGKAGWIITSGLDMYDRPVSFVYAGSLAIADGKEFDGLDDALAKKSINYALLDQGIAYPTFYKGLDDTLVKLLRNTAKAARSQKRGIWAIDRTAGFTFWETWTIQDDVVILPKLFRRLATFIDKYGSYDDLANYFKKNPDPVLVIDTGKKKDLYDLLVIKGRTIKLTVLPEDLIFIPK